MPHLHLTVREDALPRFCLLTGGGFTVNAEAGFSLRDLLCGQLGISLDYLESRFQTPPDGARPWVYWFWMNGNIAQEGITADLEAMQRVGIGGALIMSVSAGILPGRVGFMTPEWLELFAFAVREADRLGLEIIMNNDDGRTGSGGPWNSVENSMQMLTWSEVRIEGPKRFEGLLPRPPATLDHYRAIRSPPGITSARILSFWNRDCSGP
jgi:hypothetical protein